MKSPTSKFSRYALSDKHRAELHKSGLTDATIKAAGIYTVEDKAVAEILGWQPSAHFWGPAIAFPYRDSRGAETEYTRVKPDYPREPDGKAVKYESPLRAPNRAYFPPGFSELLAQPGPLVITEGEKKALGVSQHGIACIGLVGVWGWQEKRQRDDRGKAFGSRKLIPDLKRIDWKVRDVVITFDSDAVTKSSVQLAEARMAEELTKLGATVRVARIPASGDDKVGADDFIVARGEAAFRQLLVEAEPAETPPPPTPMDWARMFLDEEHRSKHGITLRWHRDEFYSYRRTHYAPIPDAEINAVLLQWLDSRGADARPRLAADVRQCLASEIRIPFNVTPPVSIRDGGYLRTVDAIAMANGLLIVGSGTNEPILLPHDPSLFNLIALPYDYDRTAQCPIWYETLNAIFSGDEECVELLGEWFGYCLTDDTRLHAILFLEGPRRSGKGTILRMMAATVGKENCASPSLTSLSELFGLWPLLGKRLAYCPDARLGHGDKARAALERLLSISGEDPVDVHRKNMPTLTNVRLPIKFAIACNALPKFGDDANALGSRVHILPCRNSFVGREDRQLEAKLKRELPGIFNWAIEGRARLGRQGEFTRPAASIEIEAEFARLVNPLLAFIEDQCEVGSGVECRRDEFFAAWSEWCKANNHEAGSTTKLGIQLRAILPGLDGRQAHSGERYYVGVRLRPTVDSRVKS